MTTEDARVGNLSAVLYAAKDLRIEDRGRPAPEPHEVLVEVRAIGVCGSDVHYYEHGRMGPYVVDSPMVIGHESAGRVVDVGGDVDKGRIGQVVGHEPGVPCGRCVQCRSGGYNLCPDVQFFATPPVHGSIAQFVALHADFAHPVPDGMDFAHAAMAEPVSVGIWANRKAGVLPGDRVLVTGAGPIGLIAAQVARASGARRICVVDTNGQRLETARGLGLDTAEPDGLRDHLFDVLLECSGAPAALRGALPHVDRAGRVVLVGMGDDEVTLDVSLVQSRELWITGTFRYANTYPAALALIHAGDVDVATLITGEFDLAHTEDAMNAARNDPTAMKSVVLPWS